MTTTEPTLRPRASSRSLKRAFKSPFSKSTTNLASGNDLPPPPLPTTVTPPVSTTVTMQKSSKKDKKEEKKKAKDAEVRYYGGDSKNYRPVTYNTAVQLNILLGGGTEEYWLAQARQTGAAAAGMELPKHSLQQEEEGTAEVGGFKDDSGQIWWDMQEKAEWTSLLPKDGQGVAVNLTDDVWVEFDNQDGRRRDSLGSTTDDSSSLLSLEVEEMMDGHGQVFFYGDAEVDQARSMYEMMAHKATTTGHVLFPIDISDESASDAGMARSIVSQAHRHLVHNNNKTSSTILLADGFEDHFLSYEAEGMKAKKTTTISFARPREAQVTMVKASSTTTPASKKGGLLKSLWRSK
ncbi:hypothetical protein FRC17_010767 [Serendipita sp. 399]|nr:hypothetical protein FRC17_010767 [Serendipita sp. 399]